MVTNWKDLIPKMSCDLPDDEIEKIIREYSGDLKQAIKSFTSPEYDFFRIGKLIVSPFKFKRISSYREWDKIPAAQVLLNKIQTIYKYSRVKVRQPSFKFTPEGFKESVEMSKERENKILKYLKKHGPSYPRAIAKELGYSESAWIMYELKKLRKEGRIKKEGKNKATKYLL